MDLLSSSKPSVFAETHKLLNATHLALLCRGAARAPTPDIDAIATVSCYEAEKGILYVQHRARRVHNLIDVQLSGFCETAEAEQTAGYQITIDCRECQPQKQEVLAVFATHMASFLKAKRIAVVTGGSLIRMQIKRVMKQPYVQLSYDRHSAHKWVIADTALAF